MRHATIMAGGSGTRLWPLSRAGQPKQLVPFIPGPDGRPRCLLEIAAARLEGLVPEQHRTICTGEAYRQQIEAILPAFTDDRILGEPCPRDTVNAVGFAAAVFAKNDPDAVFAVLTADQLIEPHDAYLKAMETGFSLVEADPTRFVSFGITPSEPATGFGYIEVGRPLADDPSGSAFGIARFVEKPDAERARAYLESGRFLWNAGMFVFHARTFLDRLAAHLPESHAGLVRIQEAWGTPEQRATLDAIYPGLPKNSVDYAIMEPCADDPAVRLTGVEMNASWIDVGSWTSFAETIEPDLRGNRAAGCATALHESAGNIVVSDDPNHTVALLGCEGLVVVRTGRATLVMPRDRAQDLKALHAELPEALR